jgi:hypothetical protein
MWVFDGEEWTQDDGSFGGGSSRRPETERPRWFEEMPELQVIEITQVPTSQPVPPFPITIP